MRVIMCYLIYNMCYVTCDVCALPWKVSLARGILPPVPAPRRVAGPTMLKVFSAVAALLLVLDLQGCEAPKEEGDCWTEGEECVIFRNGGNDGVGLAQCEEHCADGTWAGPNGTWNGTCFIPSDTPAGQRPVCQDV